MIPRRFRIFQVVMFSFAFLLGGNNAYAATKADAVILAQDIMKATVQTRKYETVGTKAPYNAIMDVILNRYTGELSTHFEKLDEKENRNIDLFKIFSSLSDMSNESYISSDKYLLLLETSASEKWRRKYLSNILLAQLHLDKSDILKTLEFSEKAIETVNSQTVTRETASMLYDAYEVLQSAYIYDRSTDQALDAIRSLIDLAGKSERELDGYSLVNNLAVLFSFDNHHLDAIEIMKVMEPFLEGQPDEKTILYNFTMGKFKNRAELYEEALPHLEQIEGKARNMWLEPYVYNQLALSYAYIGDLDKSEASMKRLESLPAEQRPTSELFTLLHTHVKSQIA